MFTVDAGGGGGGSTANVTTSSTESTATATQNFNQSVNNAQNGNNTTQSPQPNGANTSTTTTVTVAQPNVNSNNNDNNTSNVSNNSSGDGTSATVTDVAVQNDPNSDDNQGQQQQQQQQDTLFASRTNYGVLLLERSVDAYIAARNAGQTGETEEAELNNAAVNLYEDTADELRQVAANSENPEAAIQEQAAIISGRIDPNTPTGEIALNVIELATTAVMQETPEQREIQIQRTRVIRAQETLDVLENRGGIRNPDWAEAQTEYSEATAAFQETVITEISVEAATVHYENVRDSLRTTTTPTSSEISQYTADVAQAREQLDLAQQGQITLNFTDEEMQTAIQNVTERYAGLGLDAYVEAVGGALQRNRDQTAALAQIPMELSNEVAQLHLDNARGNAEANPGAETETALALAEAQFEYVQNGGFAIVFTDEEMNQAVANVRARFPDMGLESYIELVGTSFTENRDLIIQENEAVNNAARESLSSSYQVILSVNAGESCLTNIPDELAQNDPVTATFIHALGVNVNPQNPDLSIQERTIAEADPIAFALLQRAGISIQTSDVNTTIVTINGVEQELTGPQLQMVRENNVFALAGSLLSDVQFDAETQALINATVQFRYDHTQETVSALIAEGNHSEALRVLDVNMDGAFSAQEAATLWNDIGEPTFNQQYFNDQVAGLTWDSNRDFPAMAISHWVDENYANLPAPAAGYMLNAITGQYSRTEIDVLGGPGSPNFFGSLSRLVEQAPLDIPGTTQTYADMVAEWYTTDPEVPLSFVPPMGMASNFDFAMSEGNGATLSNAIVARAETLAAAGEYDEYSAQTLRDDYNFGFDQARAELYSKANREVFFEFQANETQVLSGYFDSFNSGADITQWMPAENSPALHNMVGRALGLTPINQEAANANDNTVNWFASDNPEEVGAQENIVDLTVRALLQRAGPDGQIRAIPAYLAGETVGAQNYALFEVFNAETGISEIIDGSAMSNMIYLNPNLIDSETGRLVTNIDELIAGDNIAAGDMNGGLYANWRYDSFQDFQNSNDLPDNATLYIPTAFHEAQGAGNTSSVSSLLRTDASGHVQYTGVVAGVVTNEERVRMIADVAIAIGSVGASIALAIPSGGTSLSLAVAAFTTTSIGYGIFRAGEQIQHMQDHGQSMSLSNPNARDAYMNGAASIMGGVAASSGLASNIFKGSRILSTTANVTGFLTEGYGYIQTGQQGMVLLQNANNMTQGQLAYEVFNMGMGVLDIGVGRWAGQQGRINAQLVDDARAAVTMSYDGRTVPRDFGTLSLAENGALNFTSATNGRQITIRDGTGNIRLPDLGEQTTNWLASLSADIDAFRATGADGLTFGDFITNLRFNNLSMEALGDTSRPATVNEHARALGITEPVHVSPITRMTSLGVTLMGRISQLTADFHSHSRDYARTGDAQHLIDLVQKVGRYGRILIGDIAQHCGLPHYSGIDTTPLDYENSPLLDAQNVAAYKGLVQDYQNWLGLIEQVRRLEISDDVDLATVINEATIRADRDNSGNLFVGTELIDTNLAAAIDQVRQVDPVLAQQLTDSVQRAHLALRVDLSITGFDPGDPASVGYIQGRLLENPGSYRALGEITLQKEMVTVLLGDEATLFRQQGIDNFRTALSDYLANPGDVESLSTAFQQVLPDAPQTQNMKPILRPLQEAIESQDQNQIVEAVRTLQTQLAAWEANRTERIEQFEKVLSLSAESGLAVVLHSDWGNAHTHEENGRVVATKMDYEYFDDLINLVKLYPDANIVLAHTGIGRFVRPDDQLVASEYANGAMIPRHIHMLYRAAAEAENIRFDISWNDVGEAYVQNPEMVTGLIDFLAANPDRVLFGTDTVDPGSQQHYHQATTTLTPLFLEMVRAIPEKPQMRDVLWNLVRGNYEGTIDNAGTRLLDWTANALRNQGGENVEDNITTMRETAGQLSAGRADLLRMAREEFDTTVNSALRLIEPAIQQWENSPNRDTTLWWHFLETEMGATPTVEPWTPSPDQMVRHDLYDIQTLGRAPELEPNHLHTDIAGEHTSHGRPATLAVFEQSRLQMAQEVARTAAASFIGAAFSATPADVLSNFSSILRQGAFADRIITEMKESTEWTTIFSDGNITQETVNVLHDRIIRVGKAVGAGDDQLRQVTQLTLQFQTDYQHLMNQTGWTDTERRFAVFELTGRYQINMDRALGLQARSLGIYNSRTVAGRGVNDVILDTASLSLGSTMAQAPHIFANGWTLPNIAGGVAAASDTVALTTMIARALALNHGGRTNVALVNSHPQLRWLQTVSLGALAAGGAARVVQDAAALASGDFIGLPLAVFDGIIARRGWRSTQNEYASQTRRNANTGVAENNLELVKAIAISNGIRAVQRLFNSGEDGGAEEEQLQNYLPVPSHYDRPLGTTLNWPSDPRQPDLPPAPDVFEPSIDALNPERHGSLHVIPEGGLNVRSGPSGEANPLGAFPGGSSVTPTGRQISDGSGRWIEVTGVTNSGEQVTGWVAEQYVRRTRNSTAGDEAAAFNVPTGQTLSRTQFLNIIDRSYYVS